MEGIKLITENLIMEKIDKSLPDPSYAYPGDGGIDLHSSIDIKISPLQRVVIPLGVKIILPWGKVGLIVPKSGLSANQGLSSVNSPGLIDNQYRGEINMVAYNSNDKSDIIIKKGQKVCQLLTIDAPQVNIIFDKVLDNTIRGKNGFGSSGLE